MEEHVISFETAKLAKKFGFPQDLFNTSWYNRLGKLNGRVDINADGVEIYASFDAYRAPTAIKVSREEYDEAKTIKYSAPRQSLLQKWFRDEKKFIITPYTNFNNWMCKIIHPDWEDEIEIHKTETNGYFSTYEEALEQGFIECFQYLT